MDDAGSNVIWGVLIKVSNSNDGTVDYVKGTDYLQNATDYYHTKIDWSQSQTRPANSATYYATYAMQSAATKLTLGADYTVSGTTITFTSAPSTAYGVSVAYQYGTHAGDYSTLTCQQTYDGLGGVDSTVIDTGGYCCRYLQYLAITLDWLWNYGGMTTARKAVYIYVLLKMHEPVGRDGDRRSLGRHDLGRDKGGEHGRHVWRERCDLGRDELQHHGCQWRDADALCV